MGHAADVVWKALSDRSRRRLLAYLREGPRTTGDLCGRFRTSRFAVMKHLGVLEGAGLVAVERRGRERWNYLNAAPLRRVYEEFVGPRADAWAAGLLTLERSLSGKEITMAGTFGVNEIVVEVVIDASAARVWKALVEGGGAWWPLDFVTSEKTKRFVIEPGLGGKWYEDFGEKAGVLWFTTVVWEPGSKVALTGVSIPGCGGGGPYVSNVVIALEPDGKGTRLRLSDHSMGCIDGATRASLDDGWGQLLGAFKKAVEK